VISHRADRRLHPLGFLQQEPVNGQAQLLLGMPGGRAARRLAEGRHLHHHDRELRLFQPAVRAKQGRGPQRRSDRAAGGADDKDGDPGGGEAIGHGFEAGKRDRGLAAAPEPLVERGQGGGAAGIFPHVDVPGRDAELAEGVHDVAAAQHVHADPGQVIASVRARPQQGREQGAAGQRHAGGGDAQDTCPARVLEGHRAGEEKDVDRRTEPEHLVRGFLLAPVGGGHQPPGRPGAGN